MSGGFLGISAASPDAASLGRSALAVVSPSPMGWTSTDWDATGGDHEIVRLWRRSDQLGSAVESNGGYRTATFGAGATSTIGLGGSEIDARSDPLGYGTVFTWQGDGIAAASTRVEVLVQLAECVSGPLEKDATVAEDLAYISSCSPARTGYRAIRALDSNEAAVLRHGQVDVVPHPDPVEWDRGSAIPSIDDLIERAATSICDAVERSVASDAEIFVDLTAGKDTRLVLAALHHRGLSDRVIFQTIGGDQLVDVRVAAERAAELGLRHRYGYFYPAPVGNLDDRFREHTAFTSGLGNPMDGLRSAQAPISHVRLSGLYGELLRGWRTAFSASTPSDRAVAGIASAFTATKLQLLRPHAQASAEERFWAEIVDAADPLRPAWHAAHRFYARCRLRSRACRANDATAEVRVYPLFDPKLIAVGLDAMWHHPEAPLDDLIVKRLAPELLQPPAFSSPTATSSTAAKPTTLMQQILGMQVDERSTLLGSLADLDSTAWDVIDPDAYRRAVDNYPELTNPQLRLLHGAAAGIIWLSDLVG